MRPLILVTNDDGILSPGIAAAAAAVQDLGEILVCAPRYQQTSMGRALPKDDGLGRIDVMDVQAGSRVLRGFAVHGSPAQAVSHGIHEIARRTPDLCISGINYGENLGMSLFHSGTIGAALEASTHMIPGLAVSLEAGIELHHADDYGSMDWRAAMRLTALLAEQILREGLAGDIALLNANVPADAGEATEVRVTTQSRQDYYVVKEPGDRDFGEPHRLEVTVRVDAKTLEPGSDIQAFAVDRVVSVTPLTWSLTAREPWAPRVAGA